MDVVNEFETPLRLTYLPKISSKIQEAKQLFNDAIKKHQYPGKYYYSYCTKASHFSFMVKEALKNNIHLETSSAFDIDLIDRLMNSGDLKRDTYVICNGYKPENYLEKLVSHINNGYDNFIPVLDNKNELNYYKDQLKGPSKIGIRIAANEEPNFEFYTSRLGIKYSGLIDFCKEQLLYDDKFQLAMLHFFINTGIKDNTYYWSELSKAIKMYCELRKIFPELQFLNIGGGLPVKNSLGFEYDYEYMIEEIINQIKTTCQSADVPMPDIFTEFGNYTVGQSGAIIFKVLDRKLQNDQELWYMINGSLMTTLPDIWGINHRFIMLPVNHWDKEYQRVNIGGLSCDILDYYNAEAHLNQVFLPKINGHDTPLYIGFFNVGAYQDELSGFGGIKHCLIPSPKHILVNKDIDGNFTKELFSAEQDAEAMLNILGY